MKLKILTLLLYSSYYAASFFEQQYDIFGKYNFGKIFNEYNNGFEVLELVCLIFSL